MKLLRGGDGGQDAERQHLFLRRVEWGVPPVDCARHDALAQHAFPKFVPSQELSQTWTVDHQLRSALTYTTLRLCRSSAGTPFAQLCESTTSQPLAEWPLYPTIGGANGPGTVRIPAWRVQVRGSSGQLALAFHREDPAPLRWIKERLGIRYPTPQLVITCAIDEREHLEYRARRSPDWVVLPRDTGVTFPPLLD